MKSILVATHSKMTKNDECLPNKMLCNQFWLHILKIEIYMYPHKTILYVIQFRVLLPVNYHDHSTEVICLFDNNRRMCYYSLVETQLPQSHPELSKHFYPLLYEVLMLLRVTVSREKNVCIYKTINFILMIYFCH